MRISLCPSKAPIKEVMKMVMMVMVVMVMVVVVMVMTVIMIMVMVITAIVFECYHSGTVPSAIYIPFNPSRSPVHQMLFCKITTILQMKRPRPGEVTLSTWGRSTGGWSGTFIA